MGKISNRERIISLLDSIPEYKIGYVLAYVQGIAAGAEADDVAGSDDLAAVQTARAEYSEGETIPHSAMNWN